MLRLALLLLMAAGLGHLPASAAAAKVMKVLPHLLDAQGKHTTAPSLFERDAYQAHLRAHPDLVKTVRFDIHWKFSRHYMEGVRLRLEVRGSKDPNVLTVDAPIEPRRWYKRWTPITLDEAAFKKLGEIVAWRVTVWDGDRSLAEQHSFLW